MNHRGTLIYEIQDLTKSHGDITALNIGRLQFHSGTIYGIVGPIGSGKSTLVRILAGLEKQDGGSVKYDSKEFQPNWLGKIKPNPEIFLASVNTLPKGHKVRNVISSIHGNRKDKIISTYFQSGNWKLILDRPVTSLSPGELAWLNMVVAVESYPRVLIVDDYGTLFDPALEKDFRTKLVKMNKELGTTIILAAPSDKDVKRFASVMIYLDNGHISKIRSGGNKFNSSVKDRKNNGPSFQNKRKSVGRRKSLKR